MGTQTKIAKQIIEQDGEYALALKDNHGNLFDEMRATFALAEKEGFANQSWEAERHVEKGHGRLEIREYWTLSDPEILAYLDPEHQWKGLQGIGVVRAERRMEEKTTKEIRYFLLSFLHSKPLPPQSEAIGALKTACDFVLDVAFREDESRVRIGHADENLAVLRYITLNLLRQEKSSRVGIHAK